SWAGLVPATQGWASGAFMSWDTAASPNAANYNRLALESALLAPYCNKVVDIYKCPGDRKQGAKGPRVRSYSMNCQMGCIPGTTPGPPPAPSYPPDFNSGWRQFKRTTELVDLGPSDAFVFIEEHPDSINDAYFQVKMSLPMMFPDVPGSNHDGVGALSFADGHVESHRWDFHPPVKGTPPPLQSQPAGARDWTFLTSHTTIR
ncbi:MAG TPA: hypothetical protein VK846_17270, partial [Candidatus Limnocylindria bacterium]|nr:hypothetical protein [Candidatus Limnocylindria bacterium]